jgi:purine-binding chemotaxis protein CheW
MKNFNLKSKAIASTGISYLSFSMGDESFAIRVEKILEILEVPRITKVPHSPDYVKGMINLRGMVLPIIDTRVKFGMEPTEFTVNTCIVVLDILIESERVILGILVDEVLEVMETVQEDLLPSPGIGASYRAEFIEGIIRKDDRFVMLLQIDKIFTAVDIKGINQSQVSAENQNQES